MSSSSLPDFRDRASASRGGAAHARNGRRERARRRWHRARIEERSLLGSDPPKDAAARLEIVAANQTRRILKYEPEMRAVLRLSLEADSTSGPELPMNRGLRIGWIEDALAPLHGQMPGEDLRRLIYGIGATLGIEAFVWLTDIARVSRGDAAGIMRSNASGLLRSAIADGAVRRIFEADGADTADST